MAKVNCMKIQEICSNVDLHVNNVDPLAAKPLFHIIAVSQVDSVLPLNPSPEEGCVYNYLQTGLQSSAVYLQPVLSLRSSRHPRVLIICPQQVHIPTWIPHLELILISEGMLCMKKQRLKKDMKERTSSVNKCAVHFLTKLPQ